MGLMNIEQTDVCRDTAGGRSGSEWALAWYRVSQVDVRVDDFYGAFFESA